HRNQNPIVTGVRVGDAVLWPDTPAEVAAAAPPEALLASPRDLCIGESRGAVAAEPDAEPWLRPLAFHACPGGACAKTSLHALVDAAGAEVDEAASARGSETLVEQMWINYYATGGELDEEVRLLNDAVEGFNPVNATDYEPAEEPQVSYVWMVAHDNR